MRSSFSRYAFLAFLAFATVVESSTGAAPTGVYVSAGPTTDARDSIVPAYADLDFIDGVLVRINWADIETAPGVYDWSALDRQFTLASQMGLQIALGVVNGPHAPAWLETEGAEFFDYELPPRLGGTTERLPLPWDETYLGNWESFVGELGDRYDGNPLLSLVHITHSSANGFEMPLPMTAPSVQDWEDVGYTTELHAGGVERVIDAFGNAFSETPLDLEVHPVLSDDTVSQRAVAYGNEQISERFGVLAAWWSQRNADDVYPGSYELLKDQAETSFSAVQLVASATSRPEAYGDDGLAGALDRAYDDGVRYFEIWHNDVLNPELQPVITSLRARLVPEPTAAALVVLSVALLAGTRAPGVSRG